MLLYTVQWSIQTSGRVPQQVAAELDRYIKCLRPTTVAANDEDDALEQIADLEWRLYSDAIKILRVECLEFHGRDGDFSIVGTIVKVEACAQQ